MLLKPPLGLWIVEIITYFEVFFLRDKGLRTACKNSIATKTSLHLELFSSDDYTFWAVFSEGNRTSNSVEIALPSKLTCIFSYDYTFRGSLVCGVWNFHDLVKITFPPKPPPLCDLEIVLRITHFEAVFLEGKKYFHPLVRFALLLKPPLRLWKI